MQIRLYLDEHVPTDLARHLRRLGYDVLTTSEALRASRRVPDEDQMTFAAREGRAIISFNSRDFVPLDVEWKSQGREHFGIILSSKLSLPALCARVEAHLEQYTAEQHHDLLLWC